MFEEEQDRRQRGVMDKMFRTIADMILVLGYEAGEVYCHHIMKGLFFVIFLTYKMKVSVSHFAGIT